MLTISVFAYDKSTRIALYEWKSIASIRRIKLSVEVSNATSSSEACFSYIALFALIFILVKLFVVLYVVGALQAGAS